LVNERERITVFLNASAGTASKHPGVAGELDDLFRASGCHATVRVLREGEDMNRVARDASADGSIVVAAGGDGTVSGVASGIVGSPATLGVLPLGTLNHFAKDLQIPLNLRDAVEVIAAGQRTSVDVGEVNDRVFVNNSSIGVYPDIVQERDMLRRQGHAKWPAMAIATLRVLGRAHGVAVGVEVDGRRMNRQTPFVFVGNNEYVIDGMRLGSRSSIDRGKLFLYLAPAARVSDLPAFAARALVGRAMTAGAFEIVATPELTIRTSTTRVIRVAIDGEVVKLTTPLRYRIRPGALHVLAPRP
jgi:diacylglycerol kinase family enzyme